jgi:hypothetical protein
VTSLPYGKTAPYPTKYRAGETQKCNDLPGRSCTWTLRINALALSGGASLR